MRSVTVVLACIAVLAMTCTATTDNDLSLPNLDSGLSIDGNNVELIQLKESNVGSQSGPVPVESDEELNKEDTPTGATGATGKTGATGMTGSHAKKVEKKKPVKKVAVVSFKGKNTLHLNVEHAYHHQIQICQLITKKEGQCVKPNRL